MSTTEIGKILGGRDHSTILAAERKIQYIIDVDATVKIIVNEIRRRVRTTENGIRSTEHGDNSAKLRETKNE